MAGMLPGVESARRRRCHQKSNLSELSSTTTRRSSFCLYASSSSHEFHLTTSNSSTQRSSVLCDESSLGTEAREAKKRLDQRLQPHWRSQITRRPFVFEKIRESMNATAKGGRTKDDVDPNKVAVKKLSFGSANE